MLLRAGRSCAIFDDDRLGLLARRPVRLVEDSSEEGRNPEDVQSVC